MRRILLAVVAAAALSLSAFAGTASSAPPIGGCPSSEFQLVSLETLAGMLGVPVEVVEAIPAIDTNGDRMTCVAFTANGRPHGTDNVRPLL